MWNVFKFFFWWFWLGFAAYLVVFLFGYMQLPAHYASKAAGEAAEHSLIGFSLLGFTVGFFMAIPAYFIARPKSQRNSEPTELHPY